MSKRSSLSELGFTLIELLIAICIISILIAVLVPSLLKSKDLANETTAKNNVISINLAEAAFYSTHLRFGDISELNADGYVDPKRCSSNTCIMAGYEFKITVTPDDYKISAAGKAGTFYSGPIGVINDCK